MEMAKDRAVEPKDSRNKNKGYEAPRLLETSRELPSLTHACSYASGHLPKSTTNAGQDED